MQGNAKLCRSTTIFVTFDEGGGYYDSGYIQPLSFFGDGPRVPLILVSPYARRGAVHRTFDDHVSILKYTEANWHLSPLSGAERGQPAERDARVLACRRCARRSGT